MDQLYHDKSPKAWVKPFLEALATHGVVAKAASAAGIDRSTAYVERQHNEWFRTEWEKALDLGIDMLEDVAFERAYQGSDTLLIFLLKSRRPERYRETTRSIVLNFNPADITNLSDDELDDLERQLTGTDRR